MPETDEERGARVLAQALRVVFDVRNQDPALNVLFLSALPEQDLVHLVIVLAALVPDDITPSTLLAWLHRPPPGLRPCGTSAAAARHRYRREPLCPVCRDGERNRDRLRKRATRPTRV